MTEVLENIALLVETQPLTDTTLLMVSILYKYVVIMLLAHLHDMHVYQAPYKFVLSASGCDNFCVSYTCNLAEMISIHTLVSLSLPPSLFYRSSSFLLFIFTLSFTLFSLSPFGFGRDVVLYACIRNDR